MAENEKRLREEIEAKRQTIVEPGEKVIDISLNSDPAMKVEPGTGRASETEAFDYFFHTLTAKPPFDETHFANDDEKVRFYTGLPANDVLQTVIIHIWIKASFIRCECRIFANTTNLLAMICPKPFDCKPLDCERL